VTVSWPGPEVTTKASQRHIHVTPQRMRPKTSGEGRGACVNADRWARRARHLAAGAAKVRRVDPARHLSPRRDRTSGTRHGDRERPQRGRHASGSDLLRDHLRRDKRPKTDFCRLETAFSCCRSRGKPEMTRLPIEAAYLGIGNKTISAAVRGLMLASCRSLLCLR
jgi:hypothetical protein